tara:strand:+ start:1014 stop:1424 length:411 start_codon:yes stop_codon:yes gene_type:complete
MAVQRISREFKDISLSFDVHPITKDITVLKNADAIKKSLRNIIQTIKGERFFNPTFGSEIASSLFDFVDIGSAAVLEELIRIAIRNEEPRVSVEGYPNIEVIPKIDDNGFEVTIYFDIIGQELSPQKFTYLLELNR